MEQYKQFVQVVVTIAILAVVALVVSALAFGQVRPLQDNDWMKPDRRVVTTKPLPIVRDLPRVGCSSFTIETCEAHGKRECRPDDTAIEVQFRRSAGNGMVTVDCVTECLPSGARMQMPCFAFPPTPKPKPKPEPPCNCDDGPCPDGCPS